MLTTFGVSLDFAGDLVMDEQKLLERITVNPNIFQENLSFAAGAWPLNMFLECSQRETRRRRSCRDIRGSKKTISKHVLFMRAVLLDKCM